jgi:hypothetical protein
VSEEILIPLNRPPDNDPARSTAREQLAQYLERLAAQVRADEGEKRFYAWSTRQHNLDLPSPGHEPLNDPPNAKVTTVHITWKKD